MNDLTDTKTVTLPKIPLAFRNALFIGTLTAVGLALVGDMSFKQALGTLCISNAITLSIAVMFKYLD